MTNKPTQNISQITVKMWHHVDKELITIVQNGMKTRKIKGKEHVYDTITTSVTKENL